MSLLYRLPDGSPCENCHEHLATENWVGEGGAMALPYGMVAAYCKCCCLRESLAFCRLMAEHIPELEAELREVQCGEEAKQG